MRVVPIVTAILLGGLVAAAPAARAEDEVPAEQRMQAEHLFADGLVHHVPDALRGADTAAGRLPVELAAHWWRRSIGPVPATMPAGEPLAQQRIAWARAGATEPPYPLPGGGTEDPYPLLTALVRDRVHRETFGWQGLVVPPEAQRSNDPRAALIRELVEQTSPLEAYLARTDGGRTPLEGEVLRQCLAMQARCYVGDADEATEDALDREATKRAHFAKVIYLGLLGSLLVSAFLATLIVSRDRGDGLTRHPDAS